MPISYELFCKLNASTVVGVGEIICDPNHKRSKIKAYFESNSKENRFWCSSFPIQDFRILRAGLFYKATRLSAGTDRAWVTIQPERLISHENVLPMSEVEILGRLQDSFETRIRAPEIPHTHAFFLHENHLRLNNDTYILIIPCAAVLQHYICTSALITKMAFSPHLAVAISRTIKEQEHLTPTGKQWTYGDKLSLRKLSSTPQYQIAAKMPYKHMMMAAVNNSQEKMNNSISAITQFPLTTETTLYVNYREYPAGISGHTNCRTLVIENIMDSIETELWKETMTQEYLFGHSARPTTKHFNMLH
ncbi:hypothetical protein [Pseudomonas sp. ME-P-057]|uniref:hypothetical protein n=1 Tax=Pseudomonas sp. ME-P-057 TaxID=3040321 RepID=UPI00255754BF|nr:hypothetical protein [Pseudomonas sp. ME-P-057]